MGTRPFVAFNPLTPEHSFWFQRIFTLRVQSPHPPAELWPHVPPRRRAPPGRSRRRRPRVGPALARGCRRAGDDRGRRAVPRLEALDTRRARPGGGTIPADVVAVHTARGHR